MSKRAKNPSVSRKERQRALLAEEQSVKWVEPEEMSAIQIRVVMWALRRNRLSRILLAAFFALMMTLMVVVLFYTVDNRFLFSEDLEAISPILYVPVVVATVLGLVIYMLGWRYIVNIYEPEESAPNIILWYLGIGILATCINIGWILNVISVLNSP